MQSKSDELRKRLPKSGRDAYTDRLHRHLVILHFRLAGSNGDEKAWAISSFVMSVDGCWFLITAGHCKDELDTALSAGYKVISCRLLDGFSQDSKFTQHPVPIQFHENLFVKAFKEDDFDYGVIFLESDLYVQALIANGVLPFDEQYWDDATQNEATIYRVIGLVHEASDVSPTAVRIISPVLRLEKVAPRRTSDAPSFWGKIATNLDPISDIAGMSGGPIMAFRSNEDGTDTYWLHAVQSSWFPDSKVVRGCLIKPFGEELLRILDGLSNA